ncbi:MAG: hypothetical protein HQ591_01425 [candidate division Zixibacteria bacterium]|nr:hypothetical protein [Candidatus Tariuqbacter arcticus]
MASASPVRIIDISRKLNLSTATLIDFLERNGYPVKRAHHTVLLPDILEEITSEFASGRDLVILTQLIEESNQWVIEHQNSAEEIRQVYLQRQARLRVKHQRARRVMEGRNRARLQREQLELQQQEFAAIMKSLANIDSNHDGKIQPASIDLEIIHQALALTPNKKMSFLRYLRNMLNLYAANCIIM